MDIYTEAYRRLNIGVEKLTRRLHPLLFQAALLFRNSIVFILLIAIVEGAKNVIEGVVHRSSGFLPRILVQVVQGRK